MFNKVIALIDVRNWFLLNILRMDGHNLTKFCIHFIIDRIYMFALKRVIFRKFAIEVTALD